MKNTPSALSSLPVVFLLGVPHSGSTFIHSLIDNHPQILAIPFVMRIHERRWHPRLEDASPNEIDDLIPQIFSLKVCSESNHPGCPLLSTHSFHNRLAGILKSGPITRKFFFWAVYQAYVEEAKIDLSSKKVIIEHAHTTYFVDSILSDFPDARFIQPIRDPRAMYNSAVIKARRLKGNVSEYWELKRLLHSFHNIRLFDSKLHAERFLILRNEDLLPPLDTVMKRVCKWLNIEFHENMLSSTYDGVPWKGNTAYRDMEKVNPQILSTRWKNDLNSGSKTLVEFLFYRHLTDYGYGTDFLDAKKPLKRNFVGFLSFMASFQIYTHFSVHDHKEKIDKWRKMTTAPFYRLYLYLLYRGLFPLLRMNSDRLFLIDPHFRKQISELFNWLLPAPLRACFRKISHKIRQ